MSAYEYPTLPRDAILELLSEMQIASITEKDLKHPTCDFVCDLYTRLLIHLDVLSEEDDGQIEFAVLEQLENPDLLLGSIRIMNLRNKLRKLFLELFCPGAFSLKDLLMPDPGRTEFFLGAVLNFVLYKDPKMEKLRPIVEDKNVLDEDRSAVQAKIFQLNAEIAEINNAKEKELPLVHELEARVKELQQTIANLNNQQMSLKVSFKKWREKTEDMDKELSKVEFETVQAVQENANLRSKIVQSPEKLQRALEERKAAFEEAKNAQRLALQVYQKKAAILDAYAKALKKMSKHSAQMQAVTEQANAAKSIEKDYKALRAKVTDDEVLDKSLDAILVKQRWKAEQLKESSKHLVEERDLKVEEAERKLHNVEMEVESKRHDLQERQMRAEDRVAEMDAIIQKTGEVRKSGEMKVQLLASRYEEIVKLLQQYTNSTGTLMSEMEADPAFQ